MAETLRHRFPPPKKPVPNPVLREGKRAPAFTLPATLEGRVRLTELRGRWVVLYFYPKDMTAGCSSQARDFQDAMEAFEELGVVLLGLSSDDLERHEAFAEKEELNYPLLVDRDSRVALKYGVWREKNNYGRKYMGIVRSTFVIDPSGRVARIFDNVRIKGHVAKVLAAVEEKMAQ